MKIHRSTARIEAILKILIAVQKASTKVHNKINKAGLEDILGAVGEKIFKVKKFKN